MAIETIEETLARAGQRGKVLQQAPLAALSGFRPADPPSLWTQDHHKPARRSPDTVHWRLNLRLVKICWLLIPGKPPPIQICTGCYVQQRPIRHLV